MISKLIAEATECDFKVALEKRKPKSWLKSVSAFANGIGGTLFVGIDDNRNVKIKIVITSFPQFQNQHKVF